MILISEHEARRAARIAAQRTGRPHGVLRRGDGHEVIALDYVAPAQCVCGAAADAGQACTECALRASVTATGGY